MTTVAKGVTLGVSRRLNTLMQHTYAFWTMGRPIFLLGTAPLYLLGVAAARHDNYTVQPWLVMAGLALMWLVQLMTHYNNEYRDLQTDLATAMPTRISGGSRVLVRGLVEPIAALLASAISFILALSLAVTSVLALGAGHAVLVFVALGLFLGWYYSAPPLKLASRGAGEFAIVIAACILVPNLGYYLQASAFSPKLLLTSLPLGLFIFALTLATELPDLQADQATGKMTLVARLSRNRAIWLHNIILILGWFAVGAVAAFVLPFWGGVAVVFSVPLVTIGLLTSKLSTQGQVMSMERMGVIDALLVGCVAISFSIGFALT